MAVFFLLLTSLSACKLQILINLINNGLRYSSYSHPHAYVEIEIYCVDNDVIIDILDDGNGVSNEYLKHLFNPFF